MSELSISSPAFSHNGVIPPKYTCDGADVNPPLSFANVPEKTRSLARIVDDPDAPAGTWVHRVVWNIGAGATKSQVEQAMKGHIPSQAERIGLYRRK